MRRAAGIVRIGLMTLAALSAAATVDAQDTKYFVYFGPGTEVDSGPKAQIYTGGAGLERALAEHLAVRVDFGALSYFDAEDSRTLGGIASFDAIGNLWLERRTELFGVAGYSIFVGDDTRNLFNVGGGVRHWFADDRGLLIEYRHHGPGKTGVAPNRFWTVRLGLVFR